MQGRPCRSRPIDDGDGHQRSDLAPALPLMECRKIVGAHDPDEMDAGAALLQLRDSLVAITRAKRRLDARHSYTRMPRDEAGGLDTLRKRRNMPRILQRIKRCNEPPDPIESEAMQSHQACRAVPLMWWIEAAAEQSDPQPGRDRRQPERAITHAGLMAGSAPCHARDI